jgi:predicted secreted hydrolase
VKPLVVFGKDGVSRKGASAEAASHYLTWPRLKTTGTVKVGTEERQVSGEAWMDHEFSSSQLEAGQVGWDWAAIQLKDGREIMVYRMRRKDGTKDAFSTLAVVERDGKTRHVASDAFSWEVLGKWKSPRNGAEYPIRAGIRFEDESFELRPLAEDQEQDGGITRLPYWEGACDVLDARGQVAGRAFLELAGYAVTWRGICGPNDRLERTDSTGSRIYEYLTSLRGSISKAVDSCSEMFGLRTSSRNLM